MKSKINIVLIFLVGLLVVGSLKAQVGLEKVAQSTMNFLMVSVSPKGSSMGDAYIAIGNGADAIFYNPAGLAQMNKKFEFLFTTTQWIADIKYNASALAYNWGNLGAVGLSIVSVDYGNVYATSLLPPDVAVEDELGYRDDGLMEGLGAYVLGLSYSRAIRKEFMMGGNIRYAVQSLGVSFMNSSSKKNVAKKMLFDFGLLYYPGLKSFRFGMNFRNFGTAVKYEEISAQLPLVFGIGVAGDIMDFINPGDNKKNSLIIGIDFYHPNNYTERVSVGLEYKILDAISIRGGYQSNHDVAGLSGGIGLSSSLFSKKFEFDYSITNTKFSFFKEISRISLLIRL